MKQVLIIGESSMFREYLRQKLEENGVGVSIGINALDGATKIRNILPDLIIVDYHLSRNGVMEALRPKREDPNTVNIPVIIFAQRIDQKRLIELIPYNVKKVFNKPIKIDALFAAFSELLGIPFTVDKSPGIIEAHVNDNIIFVEIAKGLNRDKLELLGFKIMEFLNIYEIKVPKVIIMFSDVKMTLADAPNMEKLLDTVIKASRAKLRHIRILTLDDFTRQFIYEQRKYDDIGVVSNLQFAVDDLLSGIDLLDIVSGEKKAEIISDRLLKANNIGDSEIVALKFDAEIKSATNELMENMLEDLKIAVIEDDFVIQELIKTTFIKTGATISYFSNGEEFLAVIDNEEFDLAFLDLNMPKVDGFGVLKVLQSRNINYPVIVLSSVAQRKVMIQAVQLGVRSYLIKPVKAKDIFKKSIEVLKANF
ncbi:MAG: response regulator [Treponema sp.]|nr:response regulator [Treponema sp.]